MPAASEHTSERRWQRWGRVLFLGAMLGLLQLLLFTIAGLLNQWSGSSMTAFDVVVLPYLFIPALAGFLSTRQSGQAASGAKPGCLVGGIGFLLLAIPLYLIMVLVLPEASSIPPLISRYVSSCVGACPAPSDPSPFNGTNITFTLLGEGGVGAICSLLGGWLGGLLGPRQGRSRRAFLLGMALAALQVLFLTLPLLLLLHGWQWWLPALVAGAVLGVVSYALVPGVEGFITGRQRGGSGSGVDGGCLVGAISMVGSIVVALALLLIAIPGLQASCQACQGNSYQLVADAPLIILAGQALASVAGGILGGWVGSILGRRQAAPQQRSATAAGHVS